MSNQFFDLGQQEQFFFTQPSEGEEVFHQKDLIEVFPFGVSITQDMNRPILLFKDSRHEITLPVSVHPLEAGVTLTQSNKAVAPVTPHRFTELLLQSLGMRIQQCVFVEIRGVHQYVRLYLSGNKSTNSIKLRADEAMSLCLHLAVPIFVTRKFVEKSKILQAQLDDFKADQIFKADSFKRDQRYIF